jgi:hypothetical protein
MEAVDQNARCRTTWIDEFIINYHNLHEKYKADEAFST